MKREDFMKAISRLAICLGEEVDDIRMIYWYENHLRNIDGEKFKEIIPKIERGEDKFPSLKKIFDYLDGEFSDRFHANYYEDEKEQEKT